MKGSVKVMRSYDYCHFEVCLGSDEDMTLEQIDDMRKDAQRLADKAVEQYKTAKDVAENRLNIKWERDRLEKEVEVIKRDFPESERTIEQKAKIKALDDYEFRLSHDYDYQDDWDEDWYN